MKLLVEGDKVLERYANRLNSVAASDGRRVMMRALNRGGDQARTQVRRSLVRQTGVKYGLIHKAIDTDRARPNKLVYQLVAAGDETNLSLFSATQRKKGVSAAPWKKRRIFRGSFIVGAYGGRVYARKTKDRWPLKPLFGPNLAREVMRDPTIHEWRKVTAFVDKRLGHELARLFAQV